MSKRTRPPNIPSFRKTQSPQSGEDRSSQAHFSLRLRMEAQRGQSWNSPSLRKAWRCHRSHLPLSARARASPPGSDLRPRRLSSADLLLGSRRARCWAGDARWVWRLFPLCAGTGRAGGEEGTARPSSKAGRGGVECQDPPRCSGETRARKGRRHGLSRLRWGRRSVSGEAT